VKQAVEVKPKSIRGAGITKDYREAIKQFIWNGIEAGATEIDIQYETVGEDLPNILSLKIVDNGSGIDKQNINNTFGAFLDSEKQSRFTKGGKGKGRFSFLAISAKAVWYTTYKNSEDNKNYFYTISVEESDSNNFDDSSQKEIADSTGTTVDFRLLRNSFTADDLDSDDFEQYLALEFGWYLEIYGKDRISVLRNGKKLNYQKYIEETDSKVIGIHDENDKEITFKVNYIQWKENIGTESRFYFLNSKHNPVERKPTGFNKVGGRAYGFVHSVYVQSDYFDNFVFSNAISDENIALLFETSSVALDQKDKVFKELTKELHNYLQNKRDGFLKEDSEHIIERFEERKTLPKFNDDPISQSRKEDYYEVVKGIYRTAPTLFINLQDHHERSLLGLLNLTLKTEEREHIIDIVGEIVELTAEERKELAQLLKNAKMSGVLKLLRTLESRYTVKALISDLVFKLTKTTKERGELQTAIENNCWLFGEEYNLIGADDSFKKLKDIYLDFIKKESKDEEEISERRPDIFIARQNKISGGITGNGSKVQNLIIELKKPSVKIGVKQYRQIEDYKNILKKTPSFNSALREWHLMIIGVDLSDDVVSMREEFKHENRPFLVNKQGDYYIYAMTWAEVFDSFDVRHDYLLKDLDYDKKQLLEKIERDKLSNTSQTTVAALLEHVQ
jgi:hypothetical protein